MYFLVMQLVVLLRETSSQPAVPQFTPPPPLRRGFDGILTLPDSILARIASGVSSPDEANGVLPDNMMYAKTPAIKKKQSGFTTYQ